MRNPQEIIAELKSLLNRSKPFRLYTDSMKAIYELETLFPAIEEPIIEDIVIGEPIVVETSTDVVEQSPTEELTIETVMENSTIEETTVEKPIAEVTEETPTPTKTTRKK